MPDIHCVTVQISQDQVAEGFYIIDGALITMVYADGETVRNAGGAPFVHHLAANEDIKAVARRLTKKVRTALRGGDIVEGFGAPINYPPMGVA